MRAHRRGAAVAGRPEPAARQPGERPRQRGERDRVRAHAAAVGRLLARPVDAAGLGDRLAHGALQRMADAEVAVERPALRHAAGESERVLARAVVAEPRRAHAVGDARVERQLRTAGERVLHQAARVEHLGDDVGVVARAAVRRARRARGGAGRGGSARARPARTLPSACSGLTAERAKTGRSGSGPATLPSGCTTHQATRCSDSTAPPRSATTRVRTRAPASGRGSPR